MAKAIWAIYLCRTCGNDYYGYEGQECDSCSLKWWMSKGFTLD